MNFLGSRLFFVLLRQE
ncbi:MAG: hypothetical protein AB4063_25705 [Crocosphaera sp.]